MEDVERLFREEIRNKKRVGSNIFSRVSTRKGGSNQALRTPYLYMTRKERKNLNGEVRVYNMSDIISYDEFINKSEKEQRELLVFWRKNFKTKEIIEGMGVSKNPIYKLLDKYDIPRVDARGRGSNNIAISQDEIDRYKNEMIPYEEFRKLNSAQKDELLEVYLDRYVAVAELSRNWTGSDVGYLYSIKNRIDKKKKKLEAIDDNAVQNEEVNEEAVITSPDETVINPVITDTESSSADKYDNIDNKIDEKSDIIDSKNVTADGHDLDVDIKTQSFTFDLKGKYSAKTIIKRLQLALDLLEDEDELLNLEIKITNQ
ncbi:hypothetical protein ACIGIJ_18550 [Bacillus paranthracis]|uniref:hypothetical protein n=1 Tax=Bacillus paranthracis TaxID=2026186 RepID=UPI0037CC4CF2